MSARVARLRELARSATTRTARQPESARDLLVVAPHPDDETLGCAARIMCARRAGRRVTVVVATDGAASHGPLRHDRADIVAARRAELAEAMSILGVPGDDVVALAFPDGDLTSHVDELARCLIRLLRERRPREVCVTAADELHPDHRAAALAASMAVGRAGSGVELLEYPVWLWADWPLSRRFAHGQGALRLLALLIAREVEKLPFDDETRSRKRAAVDAYATQLGGGPLRTTVRLPEPLLERAVTGPECFFRAGPLRRRRLSAQARRLAPSA